MPITVFDFIDGLRSSRAYFHRHLNKLAPEQWVWKPYPECKSIAETVAHLVVDDRCALESMETGAFPDFEAHAVRETEPERLIDLVNASHTELMTYIEVTFAIQPLDAEITIWGSTMKLAPGLASLTSEDHYHAGQVAFIRMAIEPSWDYYAEIYGGG